MFLHAFLFVVSWVWETGWGHAWDVSTLQVNEDYGDVGVPMGWAAGLFALPVWVTSSVNYVRRCWYSLFMASHWLFIGVFIFGALHVSWLLLSFVDFLSPLPPAVRLFLRSCSTESAHTMMCIHRSKHDDQTTVG